MNIVVTGMGLLSALGNLETTWKQLLSGASGIFPHQPFPELPTQPLALIDHRPSEDLAYQRKATIYGKILGFGLTADACYGSKPDQVGKSAIAAIQACLKNTGLTQCLYQ